MAKENSHTENSQDVVTIIRYPNRRLYNRRESRYVTMPEIQEFIQAGQNIQVVDSKSGEDLTRTVLTQIILDQHPERMELFPVSFLHGIIRANDYALEFLRNYFHQSLTYLNLMQSSPFNPLTTPTQWMKSFLPGSAGESPTHPEPAESETERLAKKVAELEKRLEELHRISEPAADNDSPKSPSAAKKRAKKKGN